MRPRATRLSKRFEIRPRMGRMTPDALTGAPAAVPADAPYKDPTLPVDARIRDLLSRMTLAEKVGQMLQLDARGGVDDLVEHYLVGSILHASPENLVRAAKLAAESRLGIPLLVGEDAIHGHSFFYGATIYP